MKEFENIFKCLPKEPSWSIDWGILENNKVLLPFIEQMKVTMQSPIWHEEGDVWTHTKMVCEELAKIKDFRNLPQRQQREVFLAALLHDVGKIYCTIESFGQLISPHHGKKGANIVRTIFWKYFSCSGDEETQNFRETVCQLIKYHMIPLHIDDDCDSKRLIQVAANGELAKDFNIFMLCLLAKADLLGRISPDKNTLLEQVELCELLARENKCFYGYRKFNSYYTQRAYLAGNLSWPDIELYDNTWGEVVLLSGLPGTGKDSWIKKYCSNIPEISLDNFRKNMKISPKDNQGQVIQAAKNQARIYLRKHQSFVWNATNITFETRNKLVNFFEKYGASVHIVFLETSWQKELQRNKKRERVVSENLIERMLNKLELPERFEAHNVDWYFI